MNPKIELELVPLESLLMSLSLRLLVGVISGVGTTSLSYLVRGIILLSLLVVTFTAALGLSNTISARLSLSFSLSRSVSSSLSRSRLRCFSADELPVKDMLSMRARPLSAVFTGVEGGEESASSTGHRICRTELEPNSLFLLPPLMHQQDVS